MKITLIHGQNHKGSTYHIARQIADKLGGDINEYFLSKDLSLGCSGCLVCLHKGREYCPHAEHVGAIFDSMLAADVIIIGSPTYVMEMTSHLKGFFEQIFTAWLSHRPEEVMFSKLAVVVSTAAGMGMSGVTKSIARQMFYLGVPKVYRLAVKVMSASWDGVSDNLKAQIDSKSNQIVRKISEIKGNVKPGIKMRFIFSIMRSFQKKNNYAPKDKDYWVSKGWLEKARPWKRTK